MTNTTALTPRSNGFSLTAEMQSIVRETYCKGATNAEWAVFLAQCERLGLDPVAKQIYSIARAGARTTQVSIDGYRLIAQRTGEYQGQTQTMYCGKDGVWTDAWLSDDYPCAAKVGVWRKGNRRAVYAVAIWASYVQTSKDGKVTAMWHKMPEVMLAKCAESQALRKAFPAELSGVYTDDEMGQADSGRVVDAAALPAHDAIAVFNGTGSAAAKPAKSVKRAPRNEPARPAESSASVAEASAKPAAGSPRQAPPHLRNVSAEIDTREDVPSGYSTLYADVMHILCLAELHLSSADMHHAAALADGLVDPGERTHAREMYRRVLYAIQNAERQKQSAEVRSGLVAKLQASPP